jgi:hypothetical protein
MSKILKRPMFRKGGMTTNGVMSLTTPRSNYQEGSTWKELLTKKPGLSDIEQMFTAARGADYAKDKKDILSNLLIRGGLGLVSGEGAGKGTLGAIATSFQKPTEQALTELRSIKQDPAAIRTAALSKYLEQEEAKKEREFELKKAMIPKAYESGTLAALQEQISTAFGKAAVTTQDTERAINLSPKIAKIQMKANADESINYGGMLKMDSNDPTKPDMGWAETQPDGSILLNPYDGQFYIKTPEGLRVADQKTYKLPETKGE